MSNFVTGLNTSETHDQAPHLDLAFLLPLVLPAGLDDHLDHHIVMVTLIFVSGTPPECKDCKEEVNCSEGKGVHASFGEGPEGVSGGGGDEEGEEGGEEDGGEGQVGGGDELCAYECKSTGGCSVRYTGPPRAGPTIGDLFLTP